MGQCIFYQHSIGGVWQTWCRDGHHATGKRKEHFIQ
ncbi:MAG: benzylsuccinate synthase beta subunit family protein [Chitinophagaceae bacterium]|nr:benzylsuccinate synthase beta subunit family protein [Chitinophagaceae bacterium]